ncbi:hypothetical protein ACTFIZ_003088 [Dictyostelium cf. discoideum]
MNKFTNICFLLSLFISLSRCFVLEYFSFNNTLFCPINAKTKKCAFMNSNSFYYNEDQQSQLSTGTYPLNLSPDPTITLIDRNNLRNTLSCGEIPRGYGGNIRGPFACIIPKNLTISEPIVINFLYEKGATLTSGGLYDSNVTISFNNQTISEIDIDKDIITIKGDALLPRDGIATKENGMSITGKFNNGTISESLECLVEIDFKQWSCKTKNQQYLSKQFEIIYTYQYPTQLKVSNFIVNSSSPSPSSSYSIYKLSSFDSIISFALIFIFLISFL